MAKRRAYVRIITRCLVARRQLREFNIEIRRPRKMNLTAYLETILIPALQSAIGTTEPLEWEHNPALGLRMKRTVDGVTIYSPAENDHRYIEYKPKSAHLQKTTGRKPGAEKTATSKGSDVWLMKKFRRIATPKKSTKPWPKGRKIRSRGFS